MARIYNVTSTLNATKAHYLTFNPTTNAVENRETFVNVSEDCDNEKLLKIIRNKVDNLAIMVTSVETISELYGMTEETFIENAVIIKADERRNLITRTMKATIASYMYIDTNDLSKGLQMATVIVDNNVETMEESKALNVVRKAVETDSKKVVTITAFNHVSELYGMKPETFVKLGVKLNPENRQPFTSEEEQG